MKRGKKNNAFTAALGKEIGTRKILEKAQENEENKILLASIEVEQNFEIEKSDEWETIAEPIDSTKPIRKFQPPASMTETSVTLDPKSASDVSKKKNSAPRTKVAKKKSAAKKSAPKKTATKKIPAVQVTAETEFERRVFAEAENDFYDEKGSDAEKKSASTFRHKIFQEQLETLPEEPAPDFDADLHRKLSRTEVAGVALSAVMMIYAYSTLDKPLFFLALSLFLHLIRPFVGSLCGKYNRAVQNALRSCSLVIFGGAIVFLFMLRM